MEKRVMTSINLFLVFSLIICLILGSLGLYKKIDNRKLDEYKVETSEKENKVEEETLEEISEEEIKDENTEELTEGES